MGMVEVVRNLFLRFREAPRNRAPFVPPVLFSGVFFLYRGQIIVRIGYVDDLLPLPLPLPLAGPVIVIRIRELLGPA